MKRLLAVLALSSAAQAAPIVLYDNGFNGSSAADGIGPGTAYSDSFVISAAATARAITFNAWTIVDPLGRDSTISTVSWAITTARFGGATLAGGTVDPIDTFLFLNGSGQNVWSESFSISDLALAPGTYFLQLGAAQTPASLPAFWDVSNGPSTSQRQGIPGNVPSHSFQIADSLATPSTGAPELDPLRGLLPVLTASLLLALSQRRRRPPFRRF